MRKNAVIFSMRKKEDAILWENCKGKKTPLRDNPTYIRSYFAREIMLIRCRAILRG
jgi:hypothetical protein